MRTDDYDYDLPTGLIAQTPAEPRDSCRLLVVDRASGQIDHRTFSDLPEYLGRGDVLVVNETRVLPARLTGAKDETGGAVEVLLLRERYEDTWECLVKPGRRLKPGARVVFGDGVLTGLVVDVIEESGGRLVRLSAREGRVLDAARRIGEVPLPPYITRPLKDPEQYQTMFARDERSAAAPTAGLHFTPALAEQVTRMGVHIAPVELDVGIDTFRPVAEDDPREHHIHTEHYRVSERAASTVNDARERGSRVVAVGTTAVRALESAFDADSGEVVAREGQTDLYILPGHRFEVVDAMVTNFHTPRSTLLMMVSAFAGRELVMRAYRTAIEERYRMLSFGDAMLIV
ncbi:MAG: tRNA preQ1(34) S-adenosylmethionine ribosyltransferase-isomerase QueA [Anaerosomatales bacterium]|nr:tRNA preQ1(34) S-adenosylmethionine ribosyltransferase-isomerase QueA [Anaerosomatales bacterium]MDT8433167.1 tRNA preQ1(34) S-adenosylmethionine ribosyltransferase-isomerase QueA [Anaerosomatales bacterium]